MSPINNDLNRTLTQKDDGQGSVNVRGPNSDAFVERMKALVSHYGSLAKVAQKGGFAESTVKKWVDGLSDPSRSRCVKLAEGTGASLLWLVAGRGPMWASEEADSVTASAPTSQPLRPADVSLAVQLAEEALEGGRLDPPDYGQLVALIHDALVNGLPSAQVLAFAKPAARGLSGGANARSTVGGTRQDAPGKGKGAT